MKNGCILAAFALALAIPANAQAHYLTVAKAKAVGKRVVSRKAAYVQQREPDARVGWQVTNCGRVSSHKVECDYSIRARWPYGGGAVFCDGIIRVRWWSEPTTAVSYPQRADCYEPYGDL